MKENLRGALPIVLVIVVLLLLSKGYERGWHCARPYFLTRGSAEHVMEGSPEFRYKSSAVFYTGRQILFNEKGATHELIYSHVPNTDKPFFESDNAEKNSDCIPSDEENERYRSILPIACYYNWPTPEADHFFGELEKSGWLTRTPMNNPEDYKSKVKSFLYRAKVGNPVISVTGILKEGNHATVEFDTSFVHLNSMGDILVSPRDLKYSSTAEFTRYDDGWRLKVLDGQIWEGGPE